MIEYGLACVLVCLLSFLDRRASPYALTILTGWTVAYVLGLLIPETAWRSWSVISLFSASVLFWLHLRRPIPGSAAIASIAAVMLALDVAYLWFRWHGVRVEVEYSHALDAGLICQLLLIGAGGIANGWVGVRAWVSGGLRRRGGLRGV